MSTELREALERVASRFRHARLWSVLALCWLSWSLVGLGLAFVVSRHVPTFGISGRSLLAAFAGLAAATGAACALLALRSARDPRWVARRVEARHPELGTGLLAAIEEDAAAPPGGLGFLQTAVIRQALEHGRAHDWEEAVPSWTLRGAKLAHVVALGLLFVAAAILLDRVRAHDGGRPPFGAGAIASDVQVEPGDAAIEKGTTLLVVARFPKEVPAEARLVIEGASEAVAPRAMTRSLEDPTFAGRVESVGSDLSYRVEFGGYRTGTYRVRVFEYPELQRADAKLVFPPYTAMEPKTVEDIRHVTAVEGTELSLLCRLNKDVASALLVDPEGKAIPLVPQDDGAHAYGASIKLAETRRYKVQLVDKEGRANKMPAELVVNVTKNRPPVVKMAQPGRDVRVSPVEELKLKAQVEDDYGVARHGVSYTAAGREPRELALGGTGPAIKKAMAEHLLDFEKLRAAPDELVTFFFWAEDVGPDGQPRRTSGDMFFAEVRHFEEIFRQGEAPPGGSSQSEGQQGENAQQAEKLAELQKQIINGTWTLMRREIGSKPTAKFAEDAKTLQESQHSAIEQAAQLAERLRDAGSKAALDQATKSMNDAEARLAEAAKGPKIAPLSPGLVAEQAAYQALLKLRAREFEVVRNSRQRGGGGRSSGGPSQRQLQQLELSNEENRYEEQSRAQQERLSQREREQRETRQVLNRLRELAQRQGDLNERLKELRSALEAAKDPQARDEIERQLKRLREQQQQILRDTDELRERMETEQNRDRMADARQQIEQGREHVRQASEALEEGRLSQALTEGTRAGRQLDQLREDLRKNASDRFSEEMTEMRDQARRLDEEQGKLTEQLDAWNRNPQRSLRDSGERQQAKEGLQRQEKQLGQLLDRMRGTVQDAEETEPLLAKELFDAVRKANEKAIPDALKIAERLADAGIPAEATKASRHAGQGIEQLKEGVEKAARSVLGDETAALKRAQGEVEDLADQVNREIALATGRNPAERPGSPPRSSSRPGRQGEDGGDQPRPDGQEAQQGGQPGEQDPQDRQNQQGQQGQQGQQRGRQAQQGQQGQRGQQEQQGGQQGQQGGQQGQLGQEGQQGGQQGQQGGQQGQQAQRGQGTLRGGNAQGGGQPSGLDRMIDGLTQGGPGGPGGPITGEGFRQWSDRMREVEELLNDPELRAEAARIRDRVRGAREEFKRHSKVPDWTQLQTMVADPIRELRDRIAEEVRRREAPDSLVPIDRDPVPPQFAEGVRRYYERLGSGK
jgi:hypothetical protein